VAKAFYNNSLVKTNSSVSQKNETLLGVRASGGEIIRPDRVQLISEDGNLGEMPLSEAIDMAVARGLDLVLVSDANVKTTPIVRLMNYSKKLYDEKKRKAAARRKHKEVQLKELRVTPTISDNDLFFKVKQAASFLQNGDKVKFVLIMKGREKTLRDTFGVEVFKKINSMLELNVASLNKALFLESESETSFGWTKVFILKK
jgi:translation initiation factor IF-3